MAALELSPAVFAILSALIEERTGLHYSLLDREALRDKASARAREAGFESLLDYYYFLRYDASSAQELDALVESLVVGETYFFREWPPIEVLARELIGPWCTAGARPRIWSAACATGEEPLSLAMRLDSMGLLRKVDLVATDLSARALERARAGHFGRRAVRQEPSPGLARAYLRPEGDGYRVDPKLVAAVDWRRVNLVDAAQVAALGTFDAILCRNVLIYFAEKTTRQVLGRLCSALRPGGALLVGVSESLMRFPAPLLGEERGGAFVYRKVAPP